MYLWLDLETTGLDPFPHSIIECAAIVTTPELEEVDRFEAKISQAGAAWSIKAAKMHLASGILDTVGFYLPNSLALDDSLVDLMFGEEREDEAFTLAGNSVHFDRGFLKRYCHRADALLSHRHFDISVLRELALLWWPDLELPEQKKPHRAMANIEQALELARFFKNQLGAKLA